MMDYFVYWFETPDDGKEMETKPIDLNIFTHQSIMLEAEGIYKKLSPMFKYCLYMFIVLDFIDTKKPAYSLKSAWSDNNIEGSQTRQQVFSELSEAVNRSVNVVSAVYARD